MATKAKEVSEKATETKKTTAKKETAAKTKDAATKKTTATKKAATTKKKAPAKKAATKKVAEKKAPVKKTEAKAEVTAKKEAVKKTENIRVVKKNSETKIAKKAGATNTNVVKRLKKDPKASAKATGNRGGRATRAPRAEAAPKPIKVVPKEFAGEIPTIEEFLQAGAHFGHRTSRWNPKMKRFIHTSRDGVHIIDLVKTISLLKKSLDLITTQAEYGSILICGTKGQAATLTKRVAEESGAFFVNKRWPGGLFTNFDTIKRSVQNLVKMEEQLAAGAEGLVKKERLMLERDIERQNKIYAGIKFMNKLPRVMVVIDSRVEKNAIREANAMGIPVVALIDTNCDPDIISNPVPANDDSIKSIKLFIELFGEAIKGGKESVRVTGLRQTHEAALATSADKYQKALETRARMEDEERERMRRMRSGEVESNESGQVVRVVKKSTK